MSKVGWNFSRDRYNRLSMDHCCQICGCKKTVDEKSPELCQYLCYWILEGWTGWNARLGEVVIRDHRAMALYPDRLSYPKMVVEARILGWTGRENVVGTFPPMKAMAKTAGR